VINVSAAQNAVRAIRLASPRVLLVTASSLAGSMVLGSVLGAAFWWLATRIFAPETVGVAVGSLSAMSLVASLSLVGAGTLLVRDIHRAGAQATALVGTATITAGTVAAVVGALFAIVAPAINEELRGLAASPLTVALFAAGVALTTIAGVLDEVLLGLLRAKLRLLRNGVFNVAKIAVLVAFGLVIMVEQPMLIYGAWGLGVLISLAVLAPLALRAWQSRPLFSWTVLRRMAPAAVSHQALNTALGLPAIGIPVAVALMVSPVTTAQFYIAFMLASMSFYAPHALSQTLYAMGSRSVDRLWDHVRVTAGLSFAAGVASVLGMLVLAEPILSLFGPQYAAAAGIAPVLAAVSIPIVVKDHFSVVFRIRKQEGYALTLCALGAAAELAAAVIGLAIAGLAGLGIGWLAAVALEALVMGPAVLRAASDGHRGGDGTESIDRPT
jgi:O-antigen/teichoic acid export membrane protein